MSVYIVCEGTTYSDIKSLRFAPEYDPTLATLPICEFEVEVVTDTSPDYFKDKTIHLNEDLGYENATNDTLAGYYNVREVERVERGVLRIKAQSLLGWLEKRTLAAELFPSTAIETFVRRLFTDIPVNDGEPMWVDDEDDPPFTIDSRVVSYEGRILGFCPQQTARERLQWMLQANMLRVVQYGKLSENGLYITASPDKNNNYYTNTQPTKLIPPDVIYKRPNVKIVNSIHNFTAVRFDSFTYTETKGQNWTSSVIRQDWDLDTQQWLDVLVYYRMAPVSFNDGTGDVGTPVVVSSNTMMPSNNTGNYQNMAQTYFREYEAEVDVLQIKHDGTNDTYIWPGDRVWFHTDLDTICTGVVKSVDFTFGKLARSKLVITTDMTPVSTGTLVVEYQYYYSGAYHTFMTHAYRLPPYTAYVYIPVPLKTSCWDGAKVVHLQRVGDQSWIYENGPAAGETKTRAVYYNRLL